MTRNFGAIRHNRQSSTLLCQAMSSPVKVPRGVQVVDWKNADGSTSIRYRVRIRRAGLNINEAFESPDEAVEFRQKMLNGEEHIKRPTVSMPSLTLQEQKDIEVVQSFLGKPPIGTFLNMYLERKLAGRDTAMADTNYKNDKLRMKYIGDTIVQYYRPANIKDVKLPGFFQVMLAPATDKFFNVPINFLDHRTINSYIDSRLKAGKAKGTIQRELNTISAAINYIFHIAPDLYKEFFLINPVKMADKAKLKGHQNPREKRISLDEEEQITKALVEYCNIEVFQIWMLAMCSGMRRSECVLLRKDAIKNGYFYLGKTKNGQTRKAIITEECQQVLDTIRDIPGERVFSYTVEGFATAWTRIKQKAKIKDVKFHDSRKEFISSLIQKMYDSKSEPSAVAIASITGMADPNHIDRTYIEPTRNGDLTTEKGIMKSVGHASLDILKRYTYIKAKK